MTIALKQITRLDGTVPPDDYDVTYDGETVGRIYRIKAGPWLWTVSGRRPTGPDGGTADDLEQAKAAFRRAWDAYG